MQVSLYSPVERRHEKQRAREQDDRDLRSGAVSHAQMAQDNGFFSPLDLSRASVRRHRRAV